MKNLGGVLIVTGAAVALIALFIMSSTVSTENMRSLSDYGGMIGTGTYSEIHNLPRAQMRELVFQGGCVLFLAGVLLAAAGQIEERLAAIGLIGDGDARAVKPPSAQIVPFETATGDPEPPNPAYIPPDPDEMAREATRNKLLISMIFIPIAIMGVVAIILATSGQSNGGSGAVAMNSSAETAEEAMNAALNAANAADAAARRAMEQ